MIRKGVRYIDQNGMLTTEGYLALGRLDGIEQGLAALSAKIEAAAAVPDASGGATVDAEARAQLAAIRAAIS